MQNITRTPTAYSEYALTKPAPTTLRAAGHIRPAKVFMRPALFITNKQWGVKVNTDLILGRGMTMSNMTTGRFPNLLPIR
jgi:hypothetical protein